MMKKNGLMKLAAALSISVASLTAAATPVLADPGRGGHGRYDRGYDGGRFDRGYRGDRGYRDGGHYRGASYYRGGRDDYRGYRGGRCRDNGTGGAIIGALAGGLLGHEVAGRGDRTTGAVLGGALGAVTGHLIDKDDGRRC